MIMLIFGDSLDAAWQAAVPLLRPAIERSTGYISEQMIYESIKENRSQLWLPHDEEGIHAAIVTSINILACGERALNVDFIGGKDMKLWMDQFLETIDTWAAAKGCISIDGSGRTGWAKMLRSYGYMPISTTYRKSLIKQVH